MLAGLVENLKFGWFSEIFLDHFLFFLCLIAILIVFPISFGFRVTCSFRQSVLCFEICAELMFVVLCITMCSVRRLLISTSPSHENHRWWFTGRKQVLMSFDVINGYPKLFAGARIRILRIWKPTRHAQEASQYDERCGAKSVLEPKHSQAIPMCLHVCTCVHVEMHEMFADLAWMFVCWLAKDLWVAQSHSILPEWMSWAHDPLPWSWLVRTRSSDSELNLADSPDFLPDLSVNGHTTRFVQEYLALLLGFMNRWESSLFRARKSRNLCKCDKLLCCILWQDH